MGRLVLINTTRDTSLLIPPTMFAICCVSVLWLCVSGFCVYCVLRPCMDDNWVYKAVYGLFLCLCVGAICNVQATYGWCWFSQNIEGMCECCTATLCVSIFCVYIML